MVTTIAGLANRRSPAMFRLRSARLRPQLPPATVPPQLEVVCPAHALSASEAKGAWAASRTNRSACIGRRDSSSGPRWANNRLGASGVLYVDIAPEGVPVFRVCRGRIPNGGGIGNRMRAPPLRSRACTECTLRQGRRRPGIACHRGHTGIPARRQLHHERPLFRHLLKDGTVATTETRQKTATVRGDYLRGHTVNERVQFWFKKAGLVTDGRPRLRTGAACWRRHRRGVGESGTLGEGFTHSSPRVRPPCAAEEARPVRQGPDTTGGLRRRVFD